MRKLIIPVIFLGLAMSQGCYYDNEEELYQFVNGQCDTTAVSYADDIVPLLQGQCNTAGCHTAGGTGNGIFENHAAVLAKVNNGSMQDRVLDQRDMPPAGTLSDCQIATFQAWLTAGAPDN